MSASVEDTIREDLEKAASLITGARRLMAEGRHVNLNAVEERVRIITETVQAAPPDVAVAFKEHLEALLDAVDAVERDLEAHHEALEHSLDTLKHREALDAYNPDKK